MADDEAGVVNFAWEGEMGQCAEVEWEKRCHRAEKALNELYVTSCFVHSETGKMNPPSMMGQKRLSEMRERLLEKIGIAEDVLGVKA